MPIRSPFAAACVLALPILAGPAAANILGNTPQQGNAVGSFAAVCTGTGNGSISLPGGVLGFGLPNENVFGTFRSNDAVCVSQTSNSPASSYTVSIPAYSGSTSMTASGFAEVDMKKIHVGGTASTTAAGASLYPTGAGQAGWTDSWTPGGQPAGTQGVILTTLHVEGTLTHLGAGVRPAVMLAPYLNGNTIDTGPGTPATLAFQALNPVPVYGSLVSVGYQTREWYLPDGDPAQNTLVVNSNVTFAIPVTFGTTYRVGIYALALGQTGSVPGSSAESDFKATITWQGASLLVGGQPASLTIASGSGIDWLTGVPEPAGLGLFGASLLGLLGLRRRG